MIENSISIMNLALRILFFHSGKIRTKNYLIKL